MFVVELQDIVLVCCVCLLYLVPPLSGLWGGQFGCSSPMPRLFLELASKIQFLLKAVSLCTRKGMWMQIGKLCWGLATFFFFLQSVSPVLCCFEELSEGVYFYNLLDRNVFKMSLTGSCKPCRSFLVALLLTHPQQSRASCCW